MKTKANHLNLFAKRIQFCFDSSKKRREREKQTLLNEFAFKDSESDIRNWNVKSTAEKFIFIAFNHEINLHKAIGEY